MPQELYSQYGLDAMTVDFMGHALALHSDDSYMRRVRGLGGRRGGQCRPPDRGLALPAFCPGMSLTHTM